MKAQFHKIIMGTNIRNLFCEHKFDGLLKNFVVFLTLGYSKCHKFSVLLIAIDWNRSCKNKGL